MKNQQLSFIERNDQDLNKKYSQLMKEKAAIYGIDTLSNIEMLSLLLGMKLEECMDVFENKSFWEIRDQLNNLKLSPTQKSKLNLLFELTKRVSKSVPNGKPVVKSPSDVSQLVMEEMRYLDHEVFRIILLNVKNHVLGVVDISKGSLTASIVHPREVFKVAIQKSCASIICVHNHPSGDPDPSKEDVETTNRLCEAGKIVGINVLDHVVIGNGRFISLKEKGLI